jgi:hypothetical protein
MDSVEDAVRDIAELAAVEVGQTGHRGHAVMRKMAAVIDERLAGFGVDQPVDEAVLLDDCREGWNTVAGDVVAASIG